MSREGCIQHVIAKHMPKNNHFLTQGEDIRNAKWIKLVIQRHRSMHRLGVKSSWMEIDHKHEGLKMDE